MASRRAMAVKRDVQLNKCQWATAGSGAHGRDDSNCRLHTKTIAISISINVPLRTCTTTKLRQALLKHLLPPATSADAVSSCDSSIAAILSTPTLSERLLGAGKS